MHPGCVLFNSCQLESAWHLIYQCSYARTVWQEIGRRLHCTVMVRGISVQDTWDKSWEKVKQGGMKRKEWAGLFACGAWQIWKQRNEKVFGGKVKPPMVLTGLILEEFKLWILYCNGAGNREGIG